MSVSASGVHLFDDIGEKTEERCLNILTLGKHEDGHVSVVFRKKYMLFVLKFLIILIFF